MKPVLEHSFSCEYFGGGVFFMGITLLALDLGNGVRGLGFCF